MVFETWLESDLKKPVQVMQLRGNLFSGDVGGNMIGVEIMDDGVAATGISGTVRGYAILANNQTIVIEGSQWCTLTGNKVTVTMPTGVYSVVGPISIVIKVGTVTVAACTSYVYRSRTDAVIDPGNVVPSLDALLQKLSDCEAATTAAENVDATATKSGNVITVTVTDRNGTSHVNTLQEPTVSVTPNDGNFDLNVTDANGTQTVTIPNPNKELSDRAHVETVSRSKTRTGNPIQIEDAVNEIADKTVIKLVPNQDLHGYSRPWVGGAGKNLFNPALFTNRTDNGLTSTQMPDGTIHIEGTSGSTRRYNDGSDIIALPAGTYIVSGSPQSVAVYSSGNRLDTNGIFTLSATTSISIGVSVPTTAIDIYEKIQIEVGQTATEWEPYANICPISGYDTVNVVRSGKNKIIKTFVGYNVESNGTFAGGSTFSAHVAQIEKGKTYIISGNTDSPNGIVYSFFYAEPTTASVSYNNSRIAQASPKYFTAPITGYVAVRSYKADANVQVEEGTVATSYEAPSGTVYPISVSTAVNGSTPAGTVYSGTVTLLADGSGNVVVDKVKITLDGTETISLASGSFNVRGDKVNLFPWPSLNTAGVNAISSGVVQLESPVSAVSQNGAFYINYRNYSATKTLRIRLDRFATADDFIDYLEQNPMEFCGEIEPVTYTLTANQVQTLLGYNYIYTDGAEIALTYRQQSLASNETLLKLLPTGSASGNPVTFSDGADSVPLKQLVVNVQPNQDLHGYGKPWVAGAWKNLCPIDVSNYTQPSSTWSSLTGTNANTYTNGTKIHLKPGTYCLSFSNTTAINGIQVFHSDGNYATQSSGQFTVTEEEDIYIRIKPTAALNFKTQIELGTTATTWVPYENICPIRGWDSVPLLRISKNLIYKATLHHSYANASTGKLNATSQASGSVSYYLETKYLPNQITFNATNGNRAYVCYMNDTPANEVQCYGIDQTSQTLPKTVTVDKTYKYIHIQFSYNQAITNPQIEPGSTATAYEAPIAHTYDISVPSEAGTVYSGTLTLDENGEGDLVVDCGIKDIKGTESGYTGSTSANANGRGLIYTDLSGIKAAIDSVVMSDKAQIVSSHTDSGISGLCISGRTSVAGYAISVELATIGLTSSATASQIVTALVNYISANNFQIVYKLANPVTYSLTADQVKTLLGTNIISSDAGTVSVKYFKVLGEEQDLSVYAKKSNPVFTGTAFKFGSHTFSLDDFAVLKILISEYDGGIPVEPATEP